MRKSFSSLKVFFTFFEPVELKQDGNKNVYLLINKLYAVCLCEMCFLEIFKHFVHLKREAGRKPERRKTPNLLASQTLFANPN